ncbi:MAG: hypothetical protein PF495_17655 [Spirochaetales bacterium]|jgi:glycosyltransferase involved in cell wall biosynthesis|nr:hypothetical protein [Spirochaetales bacterium]
MSHYYDETLDSFEGAKDREARINIFLFAAHHASGNIAAQRFRSLMSYLDPNVYQIHVLTRAPEGCLQRGTFNGAPNVSVHMLDGQCVGMLASPLVVFFVFLSAFFPRLPFVVGKMAKYSGFRSCWMINALSLASSICETKISKGEKCFVIGTYSPIDALVASRCLSVKFVLPHMQDFRDGFVFESLGRKGMVASWFRSVIERRVVQSSTLITSVSGAIVNDFRCRYPQLRIELLPNGYDPAEFTAISRLELSLEASAIVRNFPKDKTVIGHFGRLSDSDQSRLKTFEYFLKALRSDKHSLAKIHLLFVGNLTAVEDSLLKNMNCVTTVLPMIDRSLAQELMCHCNFLLLITGDLVGCATGKLFEYMATGCDVICFSGVRNEAAKILDATGSGKTILVDDDYGASALLKEITNPFRESIETLRDISAYSRRSQAAVLSAWIQKACQ